MPCWSVLIVILKYLFKMLIGLNWISGSVIILWLLHPCAQVVDSLLRIDVITIFFLEEELISFRPSLMQRILHRTNNFWAKYDYFPKDVRGIKDKWMLPTRNELGDPTEKATCIFGMYGGRAFVLVRLNKLGRIRACNWRRGVICSFFVTVMRSVCLFFQRSERVVRIGGSFGSVPSSSLFGTVPCPSSPSRQHPSRLIGV